MKKKMLSLVLAGAMTAAVLTGCGSSASTTSDAATETAAETTEEAAGTEESADAEASAETSGGTFKIGGIGPLTGGAAVYGNAAMNGSQIAVDEINAAGGINGSKIELFFEDDQADPELSVNAYNALKDKGIDFVYDESVSVFLAKLAYGSKKNARGLRDAVRREIEEKLANAIVFNQNTQINKISITADEEIKIKIN